MALVIGTNCGFVTVAPTEDPEGQYGITFDNWAVVTKDTSPANSIRITEIGWWCDTATEESNFEVGLYAADASGGAAGTLLYVERMNAKGTTSGWKTVAVNWEISSTTNYWLAAQLDNIATSTAIDLTVSGGLGAKALNFQTTLTNPWGSTGISSGQMYSIYAVVETEEPSGTNTQINIGDSLGSFATEFLGCFFISGFIFTIIEIIKHIG